MFVLSNIAIDYRLQSIVPSLIGSTIFYPDKVRKVRLVYINYTIFNVLLVIACTTKYDSKQF